MRAILLSVSIFLSVASAVAQESSMRLPQEESETNYTNPPDTKENEPTSALYKSTPLYKPDSATHPTPIRIKPKPIENPNNVDPVSFNFLYYIIQRFKSYDIID